MALTGDAAERARGARTVTTLIRYTSGMAGAGVGDMQLIPLTGMGTEPPLDSLCVLSAAAMQVFSRGRVTLASDDPRVEPAIELDLLSDERDLSRMRDGVRRIIELVRHPAVGRVAAGPLEGFIPEADLDHPDRWDDWMHANVSNYVHPAGTCRMGRADDPRAVVDLDCTLIGHQGVSVVDASVLPDVPRANTHLTVVAVAERMASRLRSDILPPLGTHGGS
ncbi:GMC family oxidoreductase [Modestobacter sp. SYSU DS0903]